MLMKAITNIIDLILENQTRCIQPIPLNDTGTVVRKQLRRR